MGATLLVGCVASAAPTWAAPALAAADSAFLPFPVEASPLGPLRARAVVLQSPTLHRGSVGHLRLQLCNADSSALEGSLQVLATAAWQVEPARRLPFRLQAFGDCVEHELGFALPDDASPGPYDAVLRVEVGGSEVGTLRTRWNRPVQWIVIGPFAPPAPGALLPPEAGINLEKAVSGGSGEVRWQRVPLAAYDDAGAVELDVVYGAAAAPQCACAFTMFDLADGERLHWTSAGTERVVVDGRVLAAGKPVRLGPGRHTLLARSCSRRDSWQFGLTLLRDDGTWPRQLDNDLDRFLQGFASALSGGESNPPAHRHVVLQVQAAAAHEVQVLGSFNAWVPWPLERAERGRWKRDLVLPPGRYAYKLRIDGRMQADPSAPRREADGFGGQNSLLIVP